jgi:PAS domain S-box-containing protein
LDGERHVVAMNPAMEALSGWRTDEVNGRHCWEVFCTQDEKGNSLCQDACPMLQALEDGASVPYAEVAILRRDGSKRQLSVSYAYVSVPSQGVGYGVAIARDITNAKEVERLKDEFVSLLSHDLRQPVAVIQGRAQFLQWLLQKKEASADSLKELGESLDVIIASTRQLNQMIFDLVESSRLESGRLELHCLSVSLPDLVRSVVRRQLQAGDQARVDVEVEDERLMVMVDPERFERVLVNLIGNALKYSPDDERVAIRVRQIDGEASVSVTDRGVGLRSQDIPYVFDRFYRAKSDWKAEGLGLGLYIARLLVEAHGGRIRAESAGPNQGSTFSCALPLVTGRDVDSQRGKAVERR